MSLCVYRARRFQRWMESTCLSWPSLIFVSRDELAGGVAGLAGRRFLLEALDPPWPERAACHRAALYF